MGGGRGAPGRDPERGRIPRQHRRLLAAEAADRRRPRKPLAVPTALVPRPRLEAGTGHRGREPHRRVERRRADRKSGEEGKSVYVRVDLGGGRIIEQKTDTERTNNS